MIKFSFVFLCILFNCICFAQTDSTTQELERPFTFVEQMPAYSGGAEAKSKFIKENIRNMSKNKPKGRVTSYVKFVVEKDGTLSDIKIIKGAMNCPACDEEAIRLISIMPKWNPGKQNGHLVRVDSIEPIYFY